MCPKICSAVTLIAVAIVAGCEASGRTRVGADRYYDDTRVVERTRYHRDDGPRARTEADRPLSVVTRDADGRAVRSVRHNDEVRVARTYGSQHDVTIEDFRSNMDTGSTLIIDARSPESYAEGHVRGAINIPAAEREQYRDFGLDGVDPDQPIIIYCTNPSCEASDMLYEYLLGEGFTNLRVFAPGWDTLKTYPELH